MGVRVSLAIVKSGVEPPHSKKKAVAEKREAMCEYSTGLAQGRFVGKIC